MGGGGDIHNVDLGNDILSFIFPSNTTIYQLTHSHMTQYIVPIHNRMHSLKIDLGKFLNPSITVVTIQNGPKSVDWLVKRTLKYVRNVIITYWIYKNCPK
jgi:hypothetical protein